MPLIVAMSASTLLTALGAMVVIGTMTETAIAGSVREGVEAFYAAEGAVEFAVGELAATADWDAVVEGETTSTFVDGAPTGERYVGAATIDLVQVTEDVNLGASALSPDTTTSYTLYAYGRFADLLQPTAVRSAVYVLVWIADVPTGDGEDAAASRVLSVLGRAYGPRGSCRSVEVSIGKMDASGGTGSDTLRVLSWRELR